MSLTCVIVEDQTMFLQMLHNMLEAMPQLKVAATARSKAEAIAACEEHLPDLLVLDLALPDGEGIAVARRLAKLKPSSKTIILSGEANTFVCPADLQSHVHAVLDKMQAFDSLAEEVKSLMPRARPTAGSARNGDIREMLTPREYEIFRLDRPRHAEQGNRRHDRHYSPHRAVTPQKHRTKTRHDRQSTHATSSAPLPRHPRREGLGGFFTAENPEETDPPPLRLRRDN